MEITPIACMRAPFGEKFGIPRQSGLVPVRCTIVFEPEFRNTDALRGLEGFDRLWLIWGFSANVKRNASSGTASWQALVRPPRLGGNTALGVFATRSPFRPNPLGLSCVEIESIELSGPDGPCINVLGADLMDGTPIYDIKPYVPYADAFPDARGGFADANPWKPLDVAFSDDLTCLDAGEREMLTRVLAQDPRPGYHSDASRIYGMKFGKWNVNFRVDENGKLLVTSLQPL
ncbi:MAG: tRNA (N6-threonylcarbamoyladenosine(37)-N6)-methyltransferase TrmO [Bacteroidales bacterium]|nr:tRNA (N6-threonylcarbamoyladenosine(37)-N6)-methyltransferase TrmO [Bacteroidales bacterium]